jgi:acyl carrier protein
VSSVVASAVKGAPSIESVHRTVTQALGLSDEDARAIAYEAPLFTPERGFDSVDLVSTIVAVERTFGVEVPQEEGTGETFRSIQSIHATVLRLRGAAGSEAP